MTQDLRLRRTEAGRLPAAAQNEVPNHVPQHLPSRFAVPGLRVMWLDEAQECPAYPGVTFDGLAVAPDGQRHYLVLTVRPRMKPSFHLHVGPDQAAIARTGLFLVAALQTYGGDLADAGAGVVVLAWLATCWTETAAELDEATTRSAAPWPGRS